MMNKSDSTPLSTLLDTLLHPLRPLRRLRSRLHGADVDHRNEMLLYAQRAAEGLLGGGALAFVSVFLVRIGTPNWLIGLYTSLPALVMMLSVLPAGSLVQRRPDLVRTVNRARAFYRGLMGCFAFLPWFPGVAAPYLMVALGSLAALPHAVFSVANTTLLGRVVPPDQRARVLSNRLAINRFVMAFIAILAGFWLEAVAFPLNYQVLFFGLLISTVASAVIFARLRVPPLSSEAKARRKKIPLSQMLPMVRGNPSFQRFLVAALIFRMGTYVPTALYPIYRVRVLGATDAWLGSLMTIQRALQMVIFFLLGKLLSRPRYRRWLWIPCLGMGLFPLTTALATTPTMLLIPALISGFMAPGMSIFLSNTLIHTSPDGQRPTFAAVNTFSVQLMAFIGPLLGTFLADIIGIQAALILGALLRMVGAIAFWRLGVGRRA
jgi:MFS family permease